MSATATTLLIDADVLRYQLAFVNARNVSFDEGDSFELVNPEKAKGDLEDIIESLLDRFHATHYVLPLSKGETFRHRLYPEYKANRKDKPKPVLWHVLDQYVHELFADHILEVPNLEADDVIGLLATHPSPRLAPGKKIVVSIDKDMHTLPCNLFNPNKPDDGVQPISEDDADRYWMTQTLTGDATDNYKGCPGIGPKKAEAILAGLATLPELCGAVLAAYKSKGLTEDDALLQARLARILRHGDYDYATKEVNLWKPKRLRMMKMASSPSTKPSKR